MVSRTDWKTVRNAGHTGVILVPSDGVGMRKVKPFLEDVVKRFAQQNATFYQVTTDIPFLYGERSLQSLMAASLTNAGSLPFTEQPLRRIAGEHKSRQTRRGALDFWVLHTGSVYLMETKHARARLKSETFPAWVHNEWRTAIEQIRSITADSVDHLRVGPFKSPVLGIAFMSVAMWQHTRPDISNMSLERIENHCLRHAANLVPKPNWAAAWAVHPRLADVLRSDSDKDSWNRYPVVLFLGLLNQLEGSPRM